MAEEVTIAAALHCSRSAVQATGLEPADFWMASPRQLWGAIQQMGTPSLVHVARLRPDLLPVAQRYTGEWWVHTHPAGLAAHAAVVRAESLKRQRVQAAVNGGDRQGWWTSYEVPE